MKLEIITIVLNGMPWITRIWPELEKLSFDWRWHVVEGAADASADTGWCRPTMPSLSTDGTRTYLDSIDAYDNRICLYRKELWRNKTVMVNEPLRAMYEPGLLMQIDSDELWTAEQITTLRDLFIKHQNKNCAYFFCDYRLGPNIRITSKNTFGNNTAYEWLRAWRFQPGMRFASHEPPKIADFEEKPFTHAETEKAGLVFRHEAYSTESQVKFKQSYYGSENNKAGHLYKDSVNGWRGLQKNIQWPLKQLKQYLPFVGENVVADRIK